MTPTNKPKNSPTWCYQIQANGKKYARCGYNTAEEAARAYDESEWTRWVRVSDVLPTVEFYAKNQGLFIDFLGGNVFRSADSDSIDFHGKRARELLKRLKTKS